MSFPKYPSYLFVSAIALLLLGSGFWQVSQNLTSRFTRANAQPTPAPSPTFQEVIQPTQVRPLPGSLDDVPMFNSNSPEWVKTPGILLSTFPPDGQGEPNAHLNYPLSGRFDLFLHHYSHTPRDSQTLYLGLLLHNPGSQPVTVEVLQAASSLMQEAPFKTLDTYIENPDGTVASGPGVLSVNKVLRGERAADFPEKLVIPPQESRLLMNHPIPVRDLEKPINGRSSLIRVESSGEVYAASLSMFAPKNADGSDRAPTVAEWEAVLNNGNLALPRDKTPTPPEQTTGQLIYGRVAGVSLGSRWQAKVTDSPNTAVLTIPEAGQAYSYPIAALRGGTLGTGQNQTAKMLVRYPDTAYEAHGNYSVEYNLTLPLNNPTSQAQRVALTLETPLKTNNAVPGGLRFRRPPQDFPFFRGTVKLTYPEGNTQKTRYVHLWHRTGQVLSPLQEITLPPNAQKTVQVDLIYPPDSTPPQVLTVRTVSANP